MSIADEIRRPKGKTEDELCMWHKSAGRFWVVRLVTAERLIVIIIDKDGLEGSTCFGQILSLTENLI